VQQESSPSHVLPSGHDVAEEAPSRRRRTSPTCRDLEKVEEVVVVVKLV